MGTPYDFNLDNNRGCLVGNWSEERCLEKITGDPRCLWVTHAETGRPRPQADQSHVRTVRHYVVEEPKDWKSKQQQDFCDPVAPENLLKYIPDHKVGARQRALEAKMHEMASKTTPEETAKPSFTSTYTAMFTEPPRPEHVGRRLQKTLDMETTLQRDYVFDKEKGLLPKHTVEAGELPDTHPPPEDIAVTLYSHQEPRDGRTNKTGSFLTHGRNSKFSQPIEEYNGVAVKDL